MTGHKAVGIHVFAGGFTRGVIDAGWKVDHQLEVHGFGLETTQRMNAVNTINTPAAEWPPAKEMPALMAFGNPRCTAFSTITSGDRYNESNAHGAWAKQTCDIHELCNYTAGNYDFIVWESVQQAYKTGRELVDYLVKEVFYPKHYRIAHLFLNAASFGNTQQRKRYFFVAYRDCYRFNIEPPSISPYQDFLYDAIWSMRDRPTRESQLYNGADDYDYDCYTRLTDDEKHVVPNLPNGWDLGMMAKWGGYEMLTPKQQLTWDWRASEMPFSMHGIYRLNWLRPSPTLHSSCARWIHPILHRPLTIGELCTIMGWPDGVIPAGPHPAAQVAKGICPSVGTWLARQVELSYEHHWGKDDWESSYCDKKCEWQGGDTDGLEKTFDLTRYTGKIFNEERYDASALRRHRFNVDGSTGRLVRSWKEIAEQSRRYEGGGGGMGGSPSEPELELSCE